jgi:hypothetical protein
MRKISIEATDVETAEGFYSALSAFSPELLEDAAGRYRVQVSLGNNEEFVAALNALHLHLTSGHCLTAPVEVDGARYMLHAD